MLFFDPVSAFIVAAVADSIIIYSEKSKNGSSEEYVEKRIREGNLSLNGDIKRIKQRYRVLFPDRALEEIKMNIENTKKNFSLYNAYGRVVIDLENQDYIIALLDACEKKYRDDERLPGFQEQADWYKAKATELRRRREKYANKLNDEKIQNKIAREKSESKNNLYILLGAAVIIVFILFVFL